MTKLRDEQRKKEVELLNEIDRTLFDFDDEIDKLSNVSDRYKLPADQIPKPNLMQPNLKPLYERTNDDTKVVKLVKKHKQRKEYTLESIKAEMIKDLKFHNWNEEDEQVDNREIIRNKMNGGNMVQVICDRKKTSNKRGASKLKTRRNIGYRKDDE